MKILYIVPAIAQGGIEQMVCTWILGMAKMGHECEVLATSIDSGYDSQLRSIGVPIHSLKLSSIKYRYSKNIIKNFLKKNKYDIIHGNVFYLNGVFAEVAHKYFPSTRFVSHAHLNSDRKCSSLISQIVNNVSHVWLKYLIRNYSNLNLACSNNSGKYLFGEGHYIFFPNAIETSRFRYDENKRTQLRTRYSLEDNVVLMHTGRFSNEKNHNFLIEVFAKVYEKNPHYKLLLFGEGELLEIIKEKVRYMGLSNGVVFMGYRRDVNEFLNAADLFILPSNIEGFPVALVEAQTNGLNCIVSKASPSECDITGLITFLSLEDSLEDWCKAIVSINYKNPRDAYYSKLSSSNFDIINSTHKLLELYKNLF